MNAAPFRFDLARHPTKDTIKMLTSLLEKVTKANDRMHPVPSSPVDSALPARHSRPRSLSHSDKRFTAFHARSIPTIGIHAYLSRILKYCPCANECFLALLVYFDRLSKSTAHRQPLRIDSFNIHRLIISGVMVASKLFSDVFYTNTRYAKVGGLPVSELNVLEVEFLTLNNYSLFVSVEELQHYGDQLLLHWMREQEGYIDSRIQPRQLALHEKELQNELDGQPHNPDDDYVHVNKVARHLSIDKGDSRQQQHHNHNHHHHHENGTDNSGSKDLNRKSSDEIDRHRCFKRPSFTQQQQQQQQQHSTNINSNIKSHRHDDTSSQHLPTPPDSSSPNNAIAPSPSSSSSHEHPESAQVLPYRVMK